MNAVDWAPPFGNCIQEKYGQVGDTGIVGVPNTFHTIALGSAD